MAHSYFSCAYNVLCTVVVEIVKAKNNNEDASNYPIFYCLTNNQKKRRRKNTGADNMVSNVTLKT